MSLTMSSKTFPYASIREVVDRQTLLVDKTWKISPEPWALSPEEVQDLKSIGKACLHFFQALERLYTRSTLGKNLLRNRSLRTPWVAEYLDRGKPEALINYARIQRQQVMTPRLMRPDLIRTEEGFIMTEIELLPGGIGITAFLNRFYQQHTKAAVIGCDDRMLHAFYDMLSGYAPDKDLPFIALLVSDEAATYRPEMEWLAQALQDLGKRVFVFHPDEVFPLGSSLCVDVEGSPQKIDVIYRFWELFDWETVSANAHILNAAEDAEFAVTPVLRPFQEEKLNLALFHHYRLQDFWEEQLPKDSLRTLRAVIPKSWIVEKTHLSPGAVLDGPQIGGRAIWDWSQLGEASQKERDLVLKISGFHKTASGARSVVAGRDVSRGVWDAAIRKALTMSGTHPHILQPFHKPKRQSHPIYEGPGELHVKQGRVRLSPYFFVEAEEVELSGILATFCPADKKIVHGMQDAALLPCCVHA